MSLEITVVDHRGHVVEHHPAPGVDEVRRQLAAIPNLTEPQARYLAASLRRVQREAQEAAARARAREEEEEGVRTPHPVHAVVGLGVVGLLARSIE